MNTNEYVKIILNASYVGMANDVNVMSEYNERTNSNLYQGCYESRFIPEFIERIENDENINGISAEVT
jgi:hypothetical protein